MNEFKGTAAPWMYAPTGTRMRDGYSQSFAVADCGAYERPHEPPNLIAGCFGDVQGGEEVAEANARLISAAPELLAACQSFVAAFSDGQRPEKIPAALIAAQSAIHKALGD